MRTKFVAPLSEEEQDNLKAEVRSTMFFVLRSAFNERAKINGVRAKDLADALGKDEGYVSRILKGAAQSITAETLIVFLEALKFHLQFNATRYEDLMAKKSNFDARPQSAVNRSIRIVQGTKPVEAATSSHGPVKRWTVETTP